MDLIDIIICCIYLVLTLVIGGISGKKQKNTEDYFLAGRSMKWWPIAISLFASLFSAISYIAIPGEAFNHGCTMLLVLLPGVLAMPLMLFIFLSFFYKLKLWTINEYLEKRFSLKIRLINSCIFMIIRLTYLGVILYSTALLLERSLGWPAWLSILVVGVFSTIYTSLGGMEAVVWTDCIQFFVLLAGVLFIIICVSLETSGGLFGIWEIAQAHHHTFEFNHEFWDFSFNSRISIWLLMINFTLAIILPATDQINLQRCFACKSFKEVVRAISASALANIPICFLFYLAGLAVFAYFTVLHPELNANYDGDVAFCKYISSYLPIGLRGLVSAGILAAVMSSVDSVQNSLATVFIKDIYQRVIVVNRSEEFYLKRARIVTIIIGVATCCFGLLVHWLFTGRQVPLLEVSNVCLGVLGAFSAPLFILGLLSYRANSWGVIIGLLAAAPVAVYLTLFRYLFLPPEERMGFLFLGLCVTFTAVIAGYIASFLTSRRNTAASQYVIWNRWSKHKEC